MVMDGADKGGAAPLERTPGSAGTHTWICWNAQVLLALRSSCAASSWKKGSSRQRKCGRGIQVLVSGGIKQPVLSTLISAGTLVLLLPWIFNKGPASTEIGRSSCWGMWFKVTSGVPSWAQCQQQMIQVTWSIVLHGGKRLPTNIHPLLCDSMKSL